MTFFFRLIALIVIMAAVWFAVSNRTPVTLDLWPLGAAELPAYLAILGALFAGYVIGGAASWYSAGKWRRRARAEKRHAEELERQIQDLNGPDRSDV